MAVATAKYKSLKFIQFENVSSWSSYALLGKNLIYTQNYAFVRIGDFLVRNKEQVTIKDDVLYKRPTISINGRGIKLRDEALGSLIGTKNQFRLHKDQFLLSKIDARNGAFGVVPEELDNGIITGNFWTFDVEYSKINPHYLQLLTGTKEFQKLCQTASVGTTNRNYLQEDLFLNFKIPLPTLAEQQKIVDAYQSKIAQAQALQTQANNLEDEIEKYVNNELGFSNEKKNERTKGLSFINFENLNRWDINFLFQTENENKSKYPLISYNDLFISLNNGIPARNYSLGGTRFLKVADIKNNQIDSTNIKFIDKFKENELIDANTLLITRKGTVGNSFYVIENGKYTASSEIFIIKLNENVDGNYIAEVNLTEFIKKQYREKNTGTIMPSLSQEKLREILIPIPPIEKQKEIVSVIQQLKSRVNKFLVEFEDTKNNAQQEFENSIFQ